MNDIAWIEKALAAARPQAMAALLRYFRDLDRAEEAFQEACLRAMKNWPEKGPPRDPAAWLIFVGRNAALDAVRRDARNTQLPSDDVLSDLDDAEAGMAERLDDAHYRDDILRLMFICCHPDLPATQQIALALRIVSGLSVREIASAFLANEKAVEQRITRAKRRVADANIPYATPGPAERAERLGAVAAMIYLVFNEGYSASGGEAHIKTQLCDEAIRLARLLLRLFPTEPEIMGLLALMLLNHARTPARLDEDGQIVLLEDQDRSLWNSNFIAEGIALVDKAMRHREPGPYQIQAAIAALHAHAKAPKDTDWQEIELLYRMLERLQPSPVVTLNRAVAVFKAHGAAPALELVEPLEERLSNYFYFHGLRGALLMELGRGNDARISFDKAISLARTPAEATHIRQHIDRLTGDGSKRQEAG
ncbi:RNA polymerase sigma factor [Nitratireductor luteus]|uniref:RNA polymerase sigma factor n=1 Tax=Nitratireductor luteus TaxID=2976980 RepID=UPI002240D8B4|nr:RNA polymerase sigma factor [Nitratireductor luteus]